MAQSPWGSYQDGQVKFRSEWKRSAQGRYIQHGVEEEWWSNGNRRLYAEWSNGVRNGKYQTWAENGEQVIDAEFRHGKPLD